MHYIILLYLLIGVTITTKTYNKAILFCTSKFWFNYRQGAGILSLYQLMRKNGFRDEDIILMIPDNLACNPRNN